MKKTAIIVLVFFLFISTGSPVQAKASRITLLKDFPPGYIAGTEGPIFANVELAQPIRRGPSAESCVSTLAHDERKSRKIGGGVLTGMGCVFILIGAQSKDDDSASGAFIAGAILAGIGLYTLAVPGYVESEYNRIRRIEDPLEREEVAYTVLTHVAHKAKVERISAAISNAVYCLYNLTYRPSLSNTNDSENYYYMALLSGGLSLYYFMVESPAERMLREYQEGQKRSGSFAIIPRPDGSIAAVYTLTF
jgi:hypothetical protein